jgi:lysophospholipase L1-like esterase
MKIYPSNLNHIRFTKPTNEEIQQKYNFPCSITVLNQSLSTAEVFYYDGEGNEFPQGRFNIPSDYLFQKALLRLDTAPTIKGLYPLIETGVYTNLGGIDAQAGKLNFASFDGTTWKLIAVDINPEVSKKIEILEDTIEDKKVGFTNWNFNGTTFTSSGTGWNGFKLLPNKHYKNIIVFAKNSGHVTFVYSSKYGNSVIQREIYSGTLNVGINILDIDVYVGQKESYMGIIPSEHTVEYADNITGSIAYYYDGDIFKIENRSIKFYAIFDDIYIKKTSIESPGVLFDFKLSNQKISSDIVNGGGGIYNENGWFAITPGLGSRIVLNKYFALGERTFICRFKGGANSQISIGSLNEFEGGMGSNYDDFLVNFATKKISYKILNGTYVEENALFLNPSNEYLSEVTRIYNKVKFTVTDLKTGEFSSIEKTFDGEGGHGAGSVNSTQTIISLLHDKHSIYLSSGDFMEVKQMTVLAGQKDVDLIAYGDSISEPEFYYPSADFSKSWTQLMKSEIESRGGKAIISGRSSTNIIQLLDRIKNELPFIRAKYVMITIGTNGGNSEENLSELVEYIFAQNSIPILNNIPCNESGTQVANNIIIENVRQKYGIKGTKFDIPTSLNYDGQVVDNSTMFLEDYSPSMQIYHHPNPKGAKLMYLRTKIDVPEIY